MAFPVLIVFGLLVLIKLFEGRVPRVTYQGFVVAGLFLPAALTIYALWQLGHEGIGWRELALFVGLTLPTGLGVTLGLHRLLTHRSFETTPAVRLAFLILGTMAFQGRCIDWAANHLKHHAYSDRAGDPHSPLDGFVHAHLGWILTAPPADRARYCGHLLRDPLVVFVDRTAMLWVVVGMVLPYLVDGWPGLLWGGFVRAAFGGHVIFAVNSVCHTFGAQPFETGDRSRNNWLMGVLALGEGWHNNHHAFPGAAFHGMGPAEPDLTGAVIRLLVRLGLAWNVRQPSAPLVERRRRVPASTAPTPV
jgi:stearoyl-CoA desaturase (delta-9 desaturase)